MAAAPAKRRRTAASAPFTQSAGAEGAPPGAMIGAPALGGGGGGLGSGAGSGVESGEQHQQRWVLLLRGVNVGGSGRLPMASLKAILENEVGASCVATYIQSGNAVLNSWLHRWALAASVGAAIECAHGFRPSSFLLTSVEVDRIVAAATSAFGTPSDLSTVHLTFVRAGDGSGNDDAPVAAEVEILTSKAVALAVEDAARLAADGEAVCLLKGVFRGTMNSAAEYHVLGLSAPNGVGRSKMFAALPKLLARRCGATAATTSRNLRTVMALKELAK